MTRDWVTVSTLRGEMSPWTGVTIVAKRRSLRSIARWRTGADQVYDDLAEAVCCLVQFRDKLTARKSVTSDDRLLRCNAIFCTVIGGEYPLAGIRREHVAELCDGQSPRSDAC